MLIVNIILKIFYNYKICVLIINTVYINQRGYRKKSIKGYRMGKPRRRMRMVSSIPEKKRKKQKLGKISTACDKCLHMRVRVHMCVYALRTCAYV